VSYVNGFRFDLKAVSDIAHDHGAKVLVDATQAVGALVTDVKKEDVDFLSAATYKYLIGPAGVAFLYVKPELIEGLTPDRTGWKNQIWREGPRELPEGAKRFEYGTLNFQGIYALKNSLIYLNKLGLDVIEKRNLELSNYLWSKLNDIGAKIYTPIKSSSHITSFFAKNARKISTTLMEEKVKVTAREAHGEHIRVSPHFYNIMEDIDLLIEKLEKIISKNPNVFEG
jgi:selenocysteine lyase/cysteine desulfurase